MKKIRIPSMSVKIATHANKDGSIKVKTTTTIGNRSETKSKTIK